METPPFERPSSELLDAVRRPISDGEPTGADVAYDDTFLSLKKEIDALGSAGGTADFDRIVELGTGILSEQSKDLAAACYLALGLTRTRGYEGLALGLAAAALLMETFWEGLYPPLRRMRARASAVQFLVERLSAWVERTDAAPADREAVEWALHEINAMQAVTAETMGEQAPAFSLLARHLRERLRKLPAPAPEAAPEAAEADEESGAPPAAPAAPAPSSAVESGGAAELRTASDAARTVLRVAQFLREQAAYDPVPFHLMRALRWGGIQQVPPHEGAATKIPAPPEARRTALAALAQQGQHEALAREAEAAFQQPPFHFWLDLQRLAASALAALGAPARAAHAAVEAEAAALARRLPQLAALTFQDGTPFADPLTVDWLAELTAQADGAAEEGRGAPAHAEALDADLKSAQTRLADGDLPGALRLLDRPEAPPGERFRRRLAAAELLYKGGRVDVARPLLEGLDAVARRHHLDSWDPGLTLNLLRLLHRCYETQGAKAAAPEKAALRERAESVVQRMGLLDPAAAVSA